MLRRQPHRRQLLRNTEDNFARTFPVYSYFGSFSGLPDLHGPRTSPLEYGYGFNVPYRCLSNYSYIRFRRFTDGDTNTSRSKYGRQRWHRVGVPFGFLALAALGYLAYRYIWRRKHGAGLHRTLSSSGKSSDASAHQMKYNQDVTLQEMPNGARLPELGSKPVHEVSGSDNSRHELPGLQNMR